MVSFGVTAVGLFPTVNAVSYTHLRRTHFVDAAYAKECALEGMARTQVIWLKEGVIKA